MKLCLPLVALEQSSVKDISSSIRAAAAEHGLLWVSGLPLAPFEKIQRVLTHVARDKELGDRLNKAYPKNLVYKDPYALGKGGPSIDRKRVLDLSPERLALIERAEPSLLQDGEDTELGQVLKFWNDWATSTGKLIDGLADAIGSEDVKKDVAFNFRMADYFEHSNGKMEATSCGEFRECCNGEMKVPRCGEHRDFGWCTLIQADGPGLEVQISGEWIAVPPAPEGCCLMFFGWCAQIRSNGRIPAALHRVVDSRPVLSSSHTETAITVPTRISAVLFCAPKNPDTVLEPVLLGQERKYIGDVRVGQLRGSMARKWRHREGTDNEQDRIDEEEEILVSNMKTQDDVVNRFIAV